MNQSPEKIESTGFHHKREQALWFAVVLIGLLILAIWYWRAQAARPSAPPPASATVTPSPSISPTITETTLATLAELSFESTKSDVDMNPADLATQPVEDGLTETATWYVRPFTTRTPTRPPSYSGGFTYSTPTPYQYLTQIYRTASALAKTGVIRTKTAAPFRTATAESLRQTSTFSAYSTAILRTPRPQQIGYSSGGNMFLVAASPLPSTTPSPEPAVTIPLDAGIFGDWTPGGLRFVFECDGQLCTRTVNLNGSVKDAPVKIANQPDGENTEPAWSHNGSWIVFRHSGGTQRPAGLYRISMGTTTQEGKYLQQLTTDPDDQMPDWSPDSSKIVFISHGDVYFINVNAALPFSYLYPTPGPGTSTPTPTVTPAPIQDRTQLTRSDGIEAWPHYSPDNRYLIYARQDANPVGSCPNPAAGPHSDIYVTDLSQVFSVEPLNLTQCQAGNQTQPVWSRETGRFLFLSDRAGGTNLYIQDRYGNVQQVTNDGGNKDRPRWRP